MDLPSIAVIEPGFSLEPSHDGERLNVRLTVNADMHAVKTLSAALKTIHEQAVRLQVRDVLCDLTALYFMNSSCFKAFVTWVTAALALEPQARYTIHLRSNGQLHWQKRSLEALRRLAEEVVSIELGA
ncbi:MAG: hypothetical protein JOZ69_17380 [Myxococcales bacterium]|nr:hypothetical protein [Myxococcales bacterium]